MEQRGFECGMRKAEGECGRSLKLKVEDSKKPAGGSIANLVE
jgi:hypothetical protein